MAAIVTRDLSKRFGTVAALEGLSVTVEAGECYGFLGPNGAGKSTTINILTGQLQPDSGEAHVAGIDPVETPIEVRHRIGVLPENGRPPSFLTVREYFEFVAAARGIEAEIESRIEVWADRLEFGSKLDTLCTDLSQGERQKVLLTQAFVHEPSVVFIDEPLTNLDPIIQARIKRFFDTYREDGNTLFLSTHFVETAAEVCTTVGIIDRGRMLEELRPSDMDGDDLLDRFLEIVGDDRGGSVADAIPGTSTDSDSTTENGMTTRSGRGPGSDR